MALDQLFDEERMKLFLDENRDILVDYLYGLPQTLLCELGIHSVRKACVSIVVKDSTMTDRLHTLFVSEPNKAPQAFKENILKEKNDGEIFLELVKDITSELDVNVLCFKILRNICRLTNSDRSILFLTRGNRDEKYLVLKFIVTQTSTFEESLTTEETEIRMPFGKSIAGHVAHTKTTVNVTEAYNDHRFDREIDKKTGYRTHSLICKPILSYDSECIGVAEIINKIGMETHEFNQRDIDVFGHYLMFCGIGLTNAQLFELSVNEYKRNRVMLKLAQHIFTELTNMESLMQKIIMDVLEISNCQRCVVYLLEHLAESFEKLSETSRFQRRKTIIMANMEVKFATEFDLSIQDDGKMKTRSFSEFTKCRCFQVAKDVVAAEKPINISNIEFDCQYGVLGFDRCCGIQTKNILCMPIFHSKGQIIGVIQLINKINEKPFNDTDESIIKTFSVLVGLGVHNCVIYEHVCKLMAKQRVSLEVISYHATAQPQETNKLIHGRIPTAEHLNLYTFEMDSHLIEDLELAKVVIRIFLETGIVEKHNVPYDVLCRWIMSVKKSYYRPQFYHNWRHAFNVCHTAFTMLYTGGMKDLFDDLEVFALLVACLCHDLDHTGPSNEKLESPLAVLYTTSITEYHHSDQCIMILNSKGNNIFGSLTSENYKSVLMFVEKAILFTDLTVYFKKRRENKAILENKTKVFADPNNKDLLISMVMTACDLTVTTKPWSTHLRETRIVFNEFIEHSQNGPFRNRHTRQELPRLQLHFMDFVCLPLYKMLSEYDVRLHPMYVGCMDNRTEWEKQTEQVSIGADVTDLKSILTRKRNSVKRGSVNFYDKKLP